MNACTIIVNNSLPFKLRTFLTNDYVILGLDTVGSHVDLWNLDMWNFTGTCKFVSKVPNTSLVDVPA